MSCESTQRLAQLISRNLREVQDFPEEGVLFRDISPLFANGQDFPQFIQILTEMYRGKISAVAGLESRGFPLAAPLAVALGLPMILIRKAGKLPGPVLHEEYTLEYGSAAMELQPESVKEGAKILIVDDVLATGGTARASVNLLKRAGASVAEVLVLMELLELHGRQKLDGIPVTALMSI